MAIKLPQRPDGDQFEDLVASCIRSLGYFVETKVELRGEQTEMLDLDVVGSPAGERFLERKLFEAKKEGCRFKHLFKLLGQRAFLGIGEAHLVGPRPVRERHEQDYERVSEEGHVWCQYLPLPTEKKDEFPERLEEIVEPTTRPDEGERAATALTGWWHQIGVRIAYSDFMSYRGAPDDDAVPARAQEYDWAAQQSFFKEEPLERVRALYDGYKRSPNLSGEMIAEQAAAEGRSKKKVGYDTYDSQKYLHIQYMMLLEHRARLAIIKNALDELLGADDGKDQGQATGLSRRGLLKRLLPDSFWDGMEALEAREHSLRIPYLFQVFLESFGGFLYLEEDDKEIELLGRLTGIPSAEVLPALKVLNDFFPPDGGWFFRHSSDESLVCLKQVPAFVRGSGCFFRHSLFELDDYAEHFNGIAWMARKWHNALFYTLTPELETNED